jgi:predicted transcriptional regulator
MNYIKIANKLKGWKTVDQVRKILGVKKSTAYVYLHKLDKLGFVVQKVKRPRGTMYRISPLPTSKKHHGMYENTDLVVSELEFTKKEVKPEQKIAYFLSKFKKEKNLRYFEEAKNLLTKIKNWKRLYRYLKAYEVKKEFIKLYLQSRKVKRLPRLPKRYKKLLSG